MSIPKVESTAITYNGDGSTREWEYPYDFSSYDVIKLKLVDDDGKVTPITTNYTHEPGRKKIIYPVNGVPLQRNQRLILYRDTPIKQEAVLPNIYPFANITKSLDYMTMILQEQRNLGERGLHFTETSKHKSITVPEGYPNSVIGWDSVGQKLQNYPFSDFEKMTDEVKRQIDAAKVKVEEIEVRAEAKATSLTQSINNKVSEVNASIQNASDILLHQGEVNTENINKAIQRADESIANANLALKAASSYAGRLDHLEKMYGTGSIDAYTKNESDKRYVKTSDLNTQLQKYATVSNLTATNNNVNLLASKVSTLENGISNVYTIEQTNQKLTLLKESIPNESDITRAVSSLFTGNHAENGWEKLPSGLIIQWGKSIKQYSVSFPITFPNYVFSVQTNAFGRTGSTSEYSGVNNFTKSSFILTGTTMNILWIAIGC